MRWMALARFLDENPTVVVFLTLGSVSLAAGIAFAVSEIPQNDLYYTFAFAVAVAFFTATIIERLLLGEFTKKATGTVERLFEQFSSATQGAINERLESIFTLLRNAEYNKIVDVLPPRRDAAPRSSNGEQSDITLSRIEDALKQSSHLKILCISGREFFWPRVERRTFYDILDSKPELSAQVLLADPEGYGIKIRGQKEDREEPDYIVGDVEDSLRQIGKLRKWHQTKASWSLEVRLYNFLPQAWFIITDEEIFLEPYHMADTAHLKKTFCESFHDRDHCCGGRVPIFVAKNESAFYEAMSHYFDWLWQHDDSAIFDGRFEREFNVRDWSEALVPSPASDRPGDSTQ